MPSPIPGASYGYWDVGDVIKEDVLQIIYQITPEDTPFFNMIGDSVAKSPLHHWLRRSLTARSAANAVQEGTDYNAGSSFLDTVLPSREFNICQIVRKLPRVTKSFQASETHGITDLMADQIEARATEWKYDTESSLLLGTLASGTSSTSSPRAMDGFHNIPPSNGSAFTSQVSVTETLFNDLLQDIWTRGGRAQDVLCGGYIKRRISGFTDSATKFFMSDDKKVVNTIGVYESDFHTTQIHLSRDVPAAGGTHALYAFDRSFFAKAWLRKPTIERLPQLGDDHRAVIIGELCLEWGDQSAAGFFTTMSG